MWWRLPKKCNFITFCITDDRADNAVECRSENADRLGNPVFYDRIALFSLLFSKIML